MMMVEIGVDRFHHAFWRHIDPEHPRHEAGKPVGTPGARVLRAARRAHRATLRLADDDTAVLVVSDHGARAMHGGFCINEWLIRKGYLALREPPAGRSPLDHALVDWKRTRAWAEGGYYARVFLNIAGREPDGTIAPEDASAVRDELRDELEHCGMTRAS